MTQTKTMTGGPAFPLTATYQSAPKVGMTLRDWFASKAPEPPEWWWLAEECPTPPPGWKEGDGAIAWQQAERAWWVDRFVLWRWFYADAMLAARNGEADT